MYHPQSDTDRLCIPTMEGGRGRLSITDSAGNKEQNLSLYLDQSEERLFEERKGRLKVCSARGGSQNELDKSNINELNVKEKCRICGERGVTYQ